MKVNTLKCLVKLFPSWRDVVVSSVEGFYIPHVPVAGNELPGELEHIAAF